MEEIRIRRRLIFDGNGGFPYRGSIYRLVVGVPLAQSHDGTLYCSWMSGTGGEPEQGHCAMYAVSKDSGQSWSEPTVFVPPDTVNGSGSVLSMDGRLYKLCDRWPLEEKYTVRSYTVSESDDNGKTWTNEHPVKFWHEGIRSAFGGILKLRDGSRIGYSVIYFPRETPLKAKAVRLAYAETEEEAQSLPEEPEDARCEDLWMNKKYRIGVGAFRFDEHFSHLEYLGAVSNRPMGLIEPSMVELSDGTLSMLCRAELGGFVWRTDSRDGGRTWLPAYETDIPSASTLVKALRLPDGRILLVLDPLGEKGGRGSRARLSLWVSDDDMKTWYLKEDLAAGGYLSYPDARLLQNGQLVVTYEDRRCAYFAEVDLPPARRKN